MSAPPYHPSLCKNNAPTKRVRLSNLLRHGEIYIKRARSIPLSPSRLMTIFTTRHAAITCRLSDTQSSTTRLYFSSVRGFIAVLLPIRYYCAKQSRPSLRLKRTYRKISARECVSVPRDNLCDFSINLDLFILLAPRESLHYSSLSRDRRRYR